MKHVSNEYKEIMNRKLRNRGYMSVVVGVINQEAQASATTEGDYLSWSEPNAIFNKGVYANYATLEEGYGKLDGTRYFPPVSTKIYKQGLITEDIAGDVTIVFNKPYDVKGLMITFGETYPTEFTVTASGRTTTYTLSSKNFDTTDVWLGATEIVIHPVSMVGGQQRMRIDSLILGVGLYFDNTDIIDSTMSQYVSAIAEEIPYINFDVLVDDSDNLYNVDDTSSVINFLETKQSVYVSYGLELDDGTIEWLDGGSLYLSDWKSQKGQMQFYAKDKFSFMDEKYDGSYRIYTRTLYQEAITILTAAGLEPDEYEIDECLQDITIQNPVPEVSYAEALQLIANAGRCILYQDVSGKIIMRANFANIIEPEDITVTATDTAAWSRPENVRIGGEVIYADLTRNFGSLDGSMRFMPANNYLETSFVSAEVADANGDFTTTPSVSMQLDAGYIYYGLFVEFSGNPPQKINITTAHNGHQVETFDWDVDSKNTIINHEFKTFDKVTITILKAQPHDRALINKISFGNLSDYTLRIEDMIEHPIGYKDKKALSISVRIITWESGDEHPEEVKDSVWYTENLNPSGTEIRYENPLIGSQEHAQLIAHWLGNYYANNISYDVTYRGEPRLDAGDIIYMESEILNNLQTEITANTLKFNGAFSGDVKLRRAMSMGGD